MSFLKVIHVGGLAKLIDRAVYSTGAAKKFGVEGIVPVVLGSDVGEEFNKHWDEHSQMLRQVLEVGLDPDVRKAIRWLVVPLRLHIAHESFLVIDEFNRLLDI